MDRRKELDVWPELKALFEQFTALYTTLDKAFLEKFNRSLPINEMLNDRWERAQRLGFGEGTSIYDSSLVFGSPQIGKNCWIGPFTIIDGSGGLKIGNQCTISAGVHIYTHDNIKSTLAPEYNDIERKNVEIGEHCYIAPNTIIAKGVQIGSHCLVAANSLVNKNYDDFSIIGGNPAKLLGKILIKTGKITYQYNGQSNDNL
jgi:acetyltransferase-like isoleucine patch superfamily enzyme